MEWDAVPLNPRFERPKGNEKKPDGGLECKRGEHIKTRHRWLPPRYILDGYLPVKKGGGLGEKKSQKGKKKGRGAGGGGRGKDSRSSNE